MISKVEFGDDISLPRLKICEGILFLAISNLEIETPTDKGIEGSIYYTYSGIILGFSNEKYTKSINPSIKIGDVINKPVSACIDFVGTLTLSN